MINDDHSLVSANSRYGVTIPVYDDGFGPLFIHRNSMGVSGIVRSQTWEDAYEICEDEFFQEASDTVPELMQEYGFRRETKKVIKCKEFIPAESRPDHLGPNEKFAENSDYSDNGKLPQGLFIRWVTIQHPDNEAWTENELFCEAYGFRPNGPNERDTLRHGIYAKDLNGDSLELLTPELANDLGITLNTIARK